MSVDSDIRDTLALVNAARSAFGEPMLAELPDSRPGAKADCLYYRALSDIGVRSVDGYGNIKFDDERKASYIASIWGTSSEGCSVAAPSEFQRTINRFDHKKVEHYNTDAPAHF